MRLRTYIANDDGKVLPGVAYHPATQGDDYLIRSLEHDTLAAHALLQAIADWHEKNGTGPDEDVYPSATVEWITKRAAEILAGWLGEE